MPCWRLRASWRHRSVLAACFLGIWLGDLGLYALARYFGRPFLGRAWVKRRVNADRLARSEAWWKKRGLLVLLVARFVPGLRLPTYLIAGTLAVPFLSFAAVTALMGLVWVPLVFTLVWAAGTQAVVWYAMAKSTLIIAAVILLVLVGLPLLFRERIRTWLRSPAMQRWLQWEFWPANLVLYSHRAELCAAGDQVSRHQPAYHRQSRHADRRHCGRIERRNSP